MVSPEYLASPLAMLSNSAKFPDKKHVGRIVLSWSADPNDADKLDLV